MLTEDVPLDTLLEKIIQDADTRVSASQHRTDSVRSRQRVEGYATKLPEIENHGKAHCKAISGSENEGSQFCGTKGAVKGAPAKSRTEKKSVSVQRKQGDCHQREAHDTCTKGDACSFRHDDSKRGKSACSSSSTPKSPTKIDEKNSSKGRPPREINSTGKRLLRPCEDYHALESVRRTLWSRQTRKLPRRCMKWRRSSWTVRRPTLT